MKRESVIDPVLERPLLSLHAAMNLGSFWKAIQQLLVGGMTIGTIFTLFIVPSLYMLIAKEHHEKPLMDPELKGLAEAVDLTPEYAPALTPDGNGNGWKKA